MKLKRKYVSLFLFLIISSLYFVVIRPNLISIHEHGHLFGMQLIFPEHQCKIVYSAEMFDPVIGISRRGSYTICPTVDRSETTINQQFIAVTSGSAFEFLLAFIILLSPFSIVGGIWMLGIAKSLLFLNYVHQADFGWMPYWAKFAISVILFLLFLVSVLLQKYYIKSFLERFGN